MRWRGLILTLIFILAPGVMLAPAWQHYGLGAGEDDILYYFPMRTLFHRAVAEGEIPTFNRWNGLGRPLIADPQTAMFYPPTWLFALPRLDVHKAYAAHLWLHYTLALWGAYRMLRGQRFKPGAAICGALVFGFCGFMLAHRNHFTMVAAAAWTPWVFWRQQRLWEGVGSGAGRARGGIYGRFLALTAVIALQLFAGHPQIGMLTLLGCAVCMMGRCWSEARAAARGDSTADASKEHADAEPSAWHPTNAGLRGAGRYGVGHYALPALWLLLPWCAAVGLFAVQWLPTVQYAALCERADWSYWEFTENSYHPASLVSWVFPMLLGNATPNFFPQPYWGPSHQSEQFGYVGIVPLVLAFFALRVPWRLAPQRRPWALLLLFSFLLALGRYGPICPLLYWLPGSQMFRCPARALLLIDLCLAVLACSVLNDLLRGLTPHRARLRAALRDATANPVKTGLLLLAPPLLALLLVLPWLSGETAMSARMALSPSNPALLLPVAATLGSLLALGVFARRWRETAWVNLVATVIALDLFAISATVHVPAGAPNLARATTPDAENHWLGYVRDDRRLWVATGRVGDTPGEYVDSLTKCISNANVLEPVASLTDYGPLQPRDYVQRFGFRPWGESTLTAELLADTSWTTAAYVGWILVTGDALPAPANGTLVTITPQGYRLYDMGTTAGFARFADATVPGAMRAEWLSSSSFQLHVAVTPNDGATGGPGSPPRNGSPSAPGSPARNGSPGAPGSLSLMAAPSRSVHVNVSLLALPGWTCRLDGASIPIESDESGCMRIPVPADIHQPLGFAYSTPGLREGAAISAGTLGIVLGFGLFGVRAQRPLFTPPADATRP